MIISSRSLRKKLEELSSQPQTGSPRNTLHSESAMQLEKMFCTGSGLFDSCGSLSSKFLPSFQELSHGSLATCGISQGSLPANDFVSPLLASFSPRASCSLLSLSACAEDTPFSIEHVADSRLKQQKFPMIEVQQLYSRYAAPASSGSASPQEHWTSTEPSSHMSTLEDLLDGTTTQSGSVIHVKPNKRFSPSATKDPSTSNQTDLPSPSPAKRIKTSNRRSLNKWKKEEDERLEEGVKLHGVPNWKPIAKHVGTRNNKMCAQRWHTCLRPEIKTAKRGKWTEGEDGQLREILSKFDCKDARAWEKAAKAMGFTRNNKQCRERWTNFLDPSLRFGPWTAEEDARLLRLYGESGNRWKLFTKELVGRSAERIRRRFKILTARSALQIA